MGLLESQGFNRIWTLRRLAYITRLFVKFRLYMDDKCSQGDNECDRQGHPGNTSWLSRGVSVTYSSHDYFYDDGIFIWSQMSVKYKILNAEVVCGFLDWIALKILPMRLISLWFRDEYLSSSVCFQPEPLLQLLCSIAYASTHDPVWLMGAPGIQLGISWALLRLSCLIKSNSRAHQDMGRHYNQAPFL